MTNEREDMTDGAVNIVRVFAVGHNMPGYLPESDVYYCDSWLSARDACESDMVGMLDYLTDWAGFDDPEEEARFKEWEANLRNAIEDLKRWDVGPGYAITVDDSNSGTVYWISCEDVPESEWEEMKDSY